MLERSKKGQVALFIIIAIVIVGLILLLVFNKRIPDLLPASKEQINVRECIEDSVDNALTILLSQGGFAEPKNYQDYMGKKIAFLCYTNEFYQTCTTQFPFLANDLKTGLELYAGDNIRDCFYALEQEYKDRGYMVSTGTLNFSVSIIPDRMIIDLHKKLIFTKDAERRAYEDFKIQKTSGLYYMLMAVHDILDGETRSCSFNQVRYMLLHPEFKIDLKTIGTEVKIYSVEYKKTGEKMTFAVRSCAQPPNIT